MAINKTNLTTQVQARINGLTGTETLKDLLILSKASEGLGVNRTPLDAAIEVALSGLDNTSEANDLLLGNKSRSMLEGQIGELRPFVNRSVKFTDDFGRVWLRTGSVDTDVDQYPEESRVSLLDNGFQSVSTRAATTNSVSMLTTNSTHIFTGYAYDIDRSEHTSDGGQGSFSRYITISGMYPRCLAADEDYLYVFGTNQVQRINLVDGTLVDQIMVSSGRTDGDSACVVNDEIYIIDSRTITVYDKVNFDHKATVRLFNPQDYDPEYGTSYEGIGYSNNYGLVIMFQRINSAGSQTLYVAPVTRDFTVDFSNTAGGRFYDNYDWTYGCTLTSVDNRVVTANSSEHIKLSTPLDPVNCRRAAGYPVPIRMPNSVYNVNDVPFADQSASFYMRVK